MKFKIERTLLFHTLQHLSKAVPQRTTLPILECVLFELHDHKLELRATDLEIAIEVILDVEEADGGVIAIPVKNLTEITNEMPEGIMEFEIADTGKVTIFSSFGKYSIMGLTPDNFPDKNVISNPNDICLSMKALSEIIDKTTYAVSREEMKPSLQGVYFQVEEKILRVVATDGHRLVKYTKHDIETGDFTGHVLIPAKFLNVMRNQLTGEGDVNLIIDKKHVQAKIGNTTISTRVINQTYPEYENVIPYDNDKILHVNKDKLIASVKRVSLFSNRSTQQIMFTILENNIRIDTEDPENISTGKETIDCEYEDEQISLSYNAKYLREALMHLDSDRVTVKLKSSASAAIFLSENSEEDIITLLMPIR